MGLADLHIHSVYSYDGTASISAILKYVADQTELGVIAVTDHDNMNGVRQAMELAPRYGVEVIPGMEVSSAEGHVLALFIDRPIAAGLSLTETVLRIGAQGGLAIAAHPEARGVNSLSFDSIWFALWERGVARTLVGVEVFNGGLVLTRSNPQVVVQARQLPLSQTGSSDAHILPMIGRGTTTFEGRTADDLRQALLHAGTEACMGEGLTGIDVLTRYLPHYMLRKLGWVTWNERPEAPLSLAPLAEAVANP